MTSLGSWPLRRARINPSAIALIDEETTTSYAELAARVESLAAGLQQRGVRHGDRVALLGRNCTEFVELMFATTRLGAIFVPLNTRLAVPELQFIVNDCGPTLLCFTDPFEDQVRALELSDDSLTTVRIDTPDRGGLLADDAAALDVPDVADSYIAMIQYTSGTSGRPKGVMLSHTSLAWNLLNTLIDNDLTGDEVSLVIAPMFHTATLNQVMLATFCKGGTCVLVAKYDPDEALALIERHGVTYMFGVPTMFAAMTHSPRWQESDLSSIRKLTCGGAPVPPSLTATYRERGLAFQQGYGLTEASPGTTFLRADRPDTPPGATGNASFFVDIRITDPAGIPVVEGERGELQVRGHNVMTGYWGNDQATADAVLPEGWLRTGDIAYQEGDLYFVVDRLKDMIISGGENIYPAEVESALAAHQSVAECAVIGVPDEHWGEVPRAVVVRRTGAGDLTATDLIEFLKGTLARYKIPRTVVFVDELPHNASGKLVKSRIPDDVRR